MHTPDVQRREVGQVAEEAGEEDGAAVVVLEVGEGRRRVGEDVAWGGVEVVDSRVRVLADRQRFEVWHEWEGGEQVGSIPVPRKEGRSFLLALCPFPVVQDGLGDRS